MNLHQIKIDFSAEQDRLLLAISTTPASDGSGQEMLLWLTRRCVKLLWPALIKLAGSAPEIVVQNHPEARQAMLGMRHEAAVQKADFSKPYEQGERERPLGEQPLLVTRMQYRAVGQEVPAGAVAADGAGREPHHGRETAALILPPVAGRGGQGALGHEPRPAALGS